MTNVIFQMSQQVSSPKSDGIPLLILVGLQREFVSAGRPLGIRNIEPSLKNCREILQAAREFHWPIAHIRFLRSGLLFNPALEFSHFISGFEPRANEMLFETNTYSPFSNNLFRAMLDGAEHRTIVIGYSSGLQCLATLVDAQLHGHSFEFVCDASSTPPAPRTTEDVCHKRNIGVIANFASINHAACILNELGRQDNFLYH